MRKAIITGLVMAALGTTAAVADIVTDREDLMKSFGGPSRTLGAMANAPDTYDAAAAKAQLQIIIDGSAKIPTMFPDGSNDPATKTLALPTVWSDRPGFIAAAAKLNTDMKAAQAATDGASFAAAYKTASADCNACHRIYRSPPQRPAAPPAQ